MDSKRLLQLQDKRNARLNKTNSLQKPLAFVINECRRYIQENSVDYKDKTTTTKKDAIKDIIIKYVMSFNHLVEGFTDDEGKTDTNSLVDRLVEAITDYDILTTAMYDDTIYEIRCNGKQLFVEKEGKCLDYRVNGKLIAFESHEQQEIVMRKLLGDVRLTRKDATISARTVEGYRLAAVHASALSPDPTDSSNDGYHAFVLRKFKTTKMSLDYIVKTYSTLSDDMARFLSIAMKGGLTFFTAGPTASGKTTTNNGVLQSVPIDTRVVLLQNPSEIDLRFKDAQGRIFNDVVHLEAREIDNPSPTDPTMENLMNQILRFSPNFVCFGELRKNIEFMLGLQIAQAGHPINCTFHAHNVMGGIMRYLTSYKAASGEDTDTALHNIVDCFDLGIVQKIQRDGTRRIVEISEIIGIDDRNRPIINKLFEWHKVGDPEYDSEGNVKSIPGVHKRVGTLSKKTLDKLQGISSKQIDFMLKPVDVNEGQSYTGENISNYGLNVS